MFIFCARFKSLSGNPISYYSFPVIPNLSYGSFLVHTPYCYLTWFLFWFKFLFQLYLGKYLLETVLFKLWFVNCLLTATLSLFPSINSRRDLFIRLGTSLPKGRRKCYKTILEADNPKQSKTQKGIDQNEDIDTYIEKNTQISSLNRW